MSVNDISSLFSFIGGLGMFLYGMNIMADGMQKTAGSKMSQFLGMLTNNRLMAVLLGALITAIIQSSGATTVMVVGFVSAGVLNLTQAVGVIMGANIGTTITAWIVSMNQLGDAFAVFQPAFFAPLLIGIWSALVFCLLVWILCLVPYRHTPTRLYSRRRSVCWEAIRFSECSSVLWLRLFFRAPPPRSVSYRLWR